MRITYNDEKKDLPCDELKTLFISAGWSDDTEDPELDKHFNAPFINSTLVISAWDDGHLIGTVRVLSDKIIRSVIYDLVVLPEYQGRGIGTELVRRCREKYPNTEWLLQTTEEIAGYYERMGFKRYKDVVLTVPSIYQA